MPLIMPNFIALGQTMYEKSVTIFYTLQYFGAPGGLPEPKFTSRGLDEKQGPVYRSVKFPPVLTTRLRDICCQISSILLTA